MSYQYTVTERRRRMASNAAGAGARGSSPGFRTGSSSSHGAFGYWIPLVLTVTAATVGIAAWVWSERSEEDESDSSMEGGPGRPQEHYPGGVPPPGYASMSGGVAPGGGMQGFPPGPGPEGAGGPGFNMGQGMGMPPQQGGFQGGPGMGPPDQGGYRSVGIDEYGQARGTSVSMQQDSGLVARMSSALGMGRSSSPANQTVDWVGKKVVAGVAAAGAMAGVAMKSMGMSGEDDAERWSEEADQRGEREPKMGIRRQGTADEFFSGSVEIPKSASLKTRKRRSVAVVVSSLDERDSGLDLGHHASILAHLPEHINPDTTRVFVLIYAPDLKAHPLSAAATSRPNLSMASSFSNISQRDADTPAQTPGEFPEDGILDSVSPNPIDDSSSFYKTLHNQAQAVVEKDTMILPFTTKNGHKHILKSLTPEVVYIQESLCGDQGEVVNDLSGWVRQTVVVIGDEGGAGGLVDTDDEDGKEKYGNKWWMKEERTGLGKRVTVVEGIKVGDDWKRRLNDSD